MNENEQGGERELGSDEVHLGPPARGASYDGRALGVRLSRRKLLERGTLGVAGLTVLPGFLAACGGDSSPQSATGRAATTEVAGEIKIGLLESLTGPFANIGRDQVRAAELYVSQNGGTLGGLEVTFITEDDRGDPTTGLQKAQKLATRDRVDLTIGVISSAVALALRDFFDQNENLLIISNAGADAITGDQFSRYIFRSSNSNFQVGYPLGPWAAEELGKTAIQVIPDYAAGHETGAAFRAGFASAGGEIINSIPVPLGTTDFGPFLAGLRRDVSFIWAGQAGTDAVNLVKQYAQFGLRDDVPLIGSGSVASQDVLPAQGDDALGIRTNYPWSTALETPENEEFLETYTAEYGDLPSPFSVFMNSAMRLLDNALQQTGGDKGLDALLPALEQTSFTGPAGPLEMDPNTHGFLQRQYLLEVQRTSSGLENVPLLILGTMAPDKPVSGQEPLP